ncbi:hypothetical protein AK812_SmicGene25488 [Symbiodinium microadriaticum]|uniref:Secreted protein n=1 Tax=Symbiodinium microadriaticum TaxID=2951 RepID=A0A1Q9DC08_SYMMI|nr:hypothetical protein AK812_SmicGene25488 [Symbiodinium microadriaticum]
MQMLAILMVLVMAMMITTVTKAMAMKMGPLLMALRHVPSISHQAMLKVRDIPPAASHGHHFLQKAIHDWDFMLVGGSKMWQSPVPIGSQQQPDGHTVVGHDGPWLWKLAVLGARMQGIGSGHIALLGFSDTYQMEPRCLVYIESTCLFKDGWKPNKKAYS